MVDDVAESESESLEENSYFARSWSEMTNGSNILLLRRPSAMSVAD